MRICLVECGGSLSPSGSQGCVAEVEVTDPLRVTRYCRIKMPQPWALEPCRGVDESIDS